jgi:hypothetical protein
MGCPFCGAEHLPTLRGGKADPAGAGPCPYQGAPYAELRAAHDQIYFGRWRRVEATSSDIRRARRQLERLLSGLARALETEYLPASRKDLEKAFEALDFAGADDEAAETLLGMDHALSYAHRVIGDLLHEKGLPPHAPADFAIWFEAGEVPFREDW